MYLKHLYSSPHYYNTQYNRTLKPVGFSLLRCFILLVPVRIPNLSKTPFFLGGNPRSSAVKVSQHNEMKICTNSQREVLNHSTVIKMD